MESPITSVAPLLASTTARFVDEHGLPGASVGIVHGGGLAWRAGVGLSDLAAARSVDTRTLYRIGSITKTFTATAIMRLRDEGKLHLDDPAVAFLPELREAASPFGPIESLTIGRLLTHESGLAGDPPDADWSGPTYEGLPERNLARAAEIGTRVGPHHQYKYSNLGYQLLGEIVARVSGVAYVEYVTREIIDPLGMHGTSFEPLPDALGERAATGYAFQPLTDTLVVAPTPPTIWSEGGLWSCVDDLGSWITLQLGASKRTDNKGLL